MAIYLMLIRHGKAVERDEDIDDRSRPLSEAGVRSLEAAFPKTLSWVPQDHDCTLWHSPLLRAAQTAQIVCGNLPISTIEERDTLAEQDTDGFIAELADYALGLAADDPERDDACQEAADTAPGDLVDAPGGDRQLVVVGHEPMMGQLAQLLCGVELPFNPGACACIRLPKVFKAQPDPESEQWRIPGKLEWFARGPESKRWKTLVDLEGILKRRYGKVLERLTDFRAHPSDVEAVHQLRVSIRTLRSLITFCEPFQTGKQNRDMQRSLRDIVRKLSLLREYDVLMEMLTDADTSQADPSASDAADGATLIEEVAQMRVEECLSVLRTFDGKRVRHCLEVLDEDFADIRWRRQFEARGLARTAVQDRFAELEESFERQAQETDYNDVEATHSLRKYAKQVRYDASCFKDLLDEGAGDAAARMKEVQNLLGDLCDARVNSDMLDGFSRKVTSARAREQALVLAENERQREREILQELES